MRPKMTAASKALRVATLTAAACALLIPAAGAVRADSAPNSNPNLALNKKYDVSDPNRYNFGIGGLTDGSWIADAKHCFATGDAAAYPKWVTINLGNPAKIAAVVTGVPPVGSTKTVDVSVSTDGVTFKPVGTYVFTQGKEERHTYSFPTTDAQYVRLTFPDHYDKVVGFPTTFSFLEECEVYATDPGK